MDELSSASERGSVASKEQAAAMVLSILPKVDAGMEVDIETLSYKLVHTCPIIQLLQSQAPDLDLAVRRPPNADECPTCSSHAPPLNAGHHLASQRGDASG